MTNHTRTEYYANTFARLIQAETVSAKGQTDLQKFYDFQDLLREVYPALFAVAEHEDIDGSLLLRWPGKSQEGPVLFANHHDVVEASAGWTYPPFSGTIADGKLWGRGVLDTKGGLWAMLQAAEELVKEGYVPAHDVYFFSDRAEETSGCGADAVSKLFQERGIRLSMVLDEGGMILEEPISGAKGTFAMVGLGEKGCADLKFIARSSGGHASTPGKNTPLVRLGQFMAAAEKAELFDVELSPVVCAMFKKIAPTMDQPMRFVLGHPELLKPVLAKVIPSVSTSAGAMLKTTLAFTMAQGSNGSNVLPQEAWVVGNMRYSHHQGGPASIEAVRKLASKFDIETVVVDPGFESALSSPDSDQFHLVEKAVSAIFPGTITSPYLMTGATDCRFFSRVCDQCLRFSPFQITQEQMASIHGTDENVDLAALAPAVDFFKYVMQEV